jgi:hypothetical protein
MTQASYVLTIYVVAKGVMLTLYKDRGHLSGFAPSSGGEFPIYVSVEGIIIGGRLYKECVHKKELMTQERMNWR